MVYTHRTNTKWGFVVIVAPKPGNEDERLQALWNYEILDTGAEAGFDDIVALISNICEVPIALVSLVDKDRQWFKAKVGLAANETSRDLAFCAHAIHNSDPLIVEDALTDQRFCDNPLVVGPPGIRFYAGAPLTTPQGFRLGTLCAIDTRPRSLTPQQLQLLKLLSSHVVSLMELRIRYRESLMLASELSESKKQIQKMAEHNSRFLASLNHEMRTPLNAILGFSNKLVKRLADVDVPQFVNEGLNTIQVASRQLNYLVEDVLSISKVDAGKMERKEGEFDPEAVLREIILVNNERASQDQVALVLCLETELPRMVVGDQGKIAQVLMNVVSNAVKYTYSNKKVSVNASYVEGCLLVDVIDEGVGIAPENLSRIFGEFEQIDNPLSTRAKGTGLGLAIVKRLIELLDGDVSVVSEIERGSKFSMRFPLPIAKNQ